MEFDFWLILNILWWKTNFIMFINYRILILCICNQLKMIKIKNFILHNVIKQWLDSFKLHLKKALLNSTTFNVFLLKKIKSKKFSQNIVKDPPSSPLKILQLNLLLLKISQLINRSNKHQNHKHFLKFFKKPNSQKDKNKEIYSNNSPHQKKWTITL